MDQGCPLKNKKLRHLNSTELSFHLWTANFQLFFTLAVLNLGQNTILLFYNHSREALLSLIISFWLCWILWEKFINCKFVYCLAYEIPPWKGGKLPCKKMDKVIMLAATLDFAGLTPVALIYCRSSFYV